MTDDGKPMIELSDLDFTKGSGLVTVVTQDVSTGAVLMVAHADRDAIEKSIESGEMHYLSRSRGPWHKGQTSGNTQAVVSLLRDCDGDAVLALVRPRGPACHTGSYSCFGDASRTAGTLDRLDAVIADRAASGEGAPGQKPSYTQRLLKDRNLRLKKIGEEAAELIAACADSDSARAVEEAADLLYHVAVALHATGRSLDDVRAALDARAR
jgi:phosphoribosyl-ATP pyrophosphohydrolase/phosphoribosyl-AMP cyclohydrolase